jgi:hypothetical protein
METVRRQFGARGFSSKMVDLLVETDHGPSRITISHDGIGHIGV